MPEFKNLAEDKDEKKLRDWGEQIIQELESDEGDREDWVERTAKWKRLYHQQDMPVAPQNEWTSTESLPLMAEACNQHANRAYKAFFPGRKPIKAIPVGNETPLDRERADRVSKHISWQLLVQNRKYKRDKRRLLLSTPIAGSMFTKTYRDPVKNRNVVENVRAEDLVVPYGVGPRDIEAVDRKTHIKYPTIFRTRQLAEQDFFLSPAVKWEDGDVRDTTTANEDAEGVIRTDTHENDLQLAQVCEQHRWMDIGDGTKPYTFWVDRQDRSIKRIQQRWVDDPGEPDEQFTHWPFLENPDGFYGLGMGHLIGELNAAANMITRQSIDAGTLSTIGNHSGFIDQAFAPEGAEVFMELGKLKKVQFGGDDIRKAIFSFNFPGPTPAMLQILELILNRSDRLATVTEAITGQTNTVMQPTTILALIEQALEQFTTIQEGQIEAWADELGRWYNLNYLYFDEAEYFAVTEDLDPTSVGEQQIEIRKEDYAPDMQIMPVADPKMATEQQRLAKAQAELEYARSSPLVMNNPESLYRFERGYLETLQVEGISEKLPPPETQEPQREDNPDIENFGALLPSPQVPPVHEQQDHLTHLKSHDAFLADEQYGQAMTPEGQQAMAEHRQTHLAMLYLVTETTALEDLEDGQRQPGDLAAQQADPRVPI